MRIEFGIRKGTNGRGALPFVLPPFFEEVRCGDIAINASTWNERRPKPHIGIHHASQPICQNSFALDKRDVFCWVRSFRDQLNDQSYIVKGKVAHCPARTGNGHSFVWG